MFFLFLSLQTTVRKRYMPRTPSGSPPPDYPEVKILEINNKIT
jgi:hypothetical protein